MRFGDVETLFHEVGHILHSVLARIPEAWANMHTPYPWMAAARSIPLDFIETPSQILENWIWEPEVLDMISKHCKTGERLPAKLRENLIATRDFNNGMFYAGQLTLAIVDQKWHTTKGNVDTDAIYEQIDEEITGLAPLKGKRYSSRFGHAMGGYDAGYYSYLWSEVYALDCFSRFKKEGIFNQKTGMEFRKRVLEPGDSKPAIELLRGFLGREPSMDAFYERLGIKK